MSSDTFVREARSGVRRLDQGLLDLESEADQRVVDDLFRTAHSLKSTFDMEGYDQASELAHALEDVLEAIRAGTLAPSGRVIDRALAAADVLDAMLDEIEQQGRTETVPTKQIETLRQTAESTERAEPEDGVAGVDGTSTRSGQSPTESGDAGGTVAEGEPSDIDPEVEAALDAASEFDDLDSLMAEMDDEEGTEMETLEGGGSFDDILDEETDVDEETDADGSLDVAARDEELETTAREPDQEADLAEDVPFDDVAAGSAQDPFVWAKSTVEEDTSLDELQAEIEAESFGEFDDEDDMTIQELLALDADKAEGTTSDDGIADEPTTAGTSDGPDGIEAASSGDSTDAWSSLDTNAGETSAEAADESGDADALQTIIDALDESSAEADTADARSSDSVRTESMAETETEDDTASVPSRDRSGSTTRGQRPGERVESAGDDATASAETDVSAFGTDGELDAFESRFGSLFDEEETATAPARAAATIEGSSLTAAPFRARSDRQSAVESGTDATQSVQSLTVDVEYADDLLSLAEGLTVEAQRLRERAKTDAVRESADTIGSSVRELRRTVMEIRLMPIETVTNRLDRVVRDATRGTDTEAELEVEGAGVRVDRSIIDSLRDPLVHLVRNAVDHGIEPPQERERKGKPATGTVTVRARRRGDDVRIEVSDDGSGIDPGALREAAVEAGVFDRAETLALSDADTYDLIFHPGLSTVEEVTSTSGRGVGMDVVRETVTALDGDVTVESGDTGTTVTLELPVSKAVSEVVIVAAGDAEFAIPTADVRRIGRADGGTLTDGLLSAPTNRTVDLAEELGLAADDPADGTASERAVVAVDTTAGTLGIECDRIVDQRETVITPYDDVLADVPGISGATTGTDGQLIQVIDTEEL